MSRFDFLSSEFNIVDDLDDNRENYRSFGSLDGIVTSDMRHHAEQKKEKSPPQEKTDELKKDSEEVCCPVETEEQSQTLPLTITSRGRTLIIGADIERAIEYGEFLNERGLICTVCVPTCGKSEYSLSRKGPLTLIKADAVSISGSFGGFTATSVAGGDKTNLSALLEDKVACFDLVLDLQPTPLYAGKLLPIGYYAPGENTVRINEALAELPEMHGVFTKPRFSVLLENRCFHGRSRTHDCRLCLDICPVSAMTSLDRRIVIDPYLCQGCGGCALVCPADAIRMLVPPQKELLSALAGLLSDAAVEGKPPPDLVVYDRSIDSANLRSMAARNEDTRIFFGVEDVGRVGLDVLLVALAKGAGSVTLICGTEVPGPVRQSLKDEAELGKMILKGLHLSADRIRLVVHPPDWIDPPDSIFGEKGESSGSAKPLFPHTDFSFEHDKRTLIRMAARHLFEVSAPGQPAIPLPVDAPFGTITIDATACSFCMTCVGSCPSGALTASDEKPCISFVESLCHQCGLCAEACPEDAIQLLPRLLCTEAADNPSVLREVEPFKCIKCGVPFASQAMISRMQEKLSGHWMYSSDRQLQRLQMCRTCRTRDALTSGDFRS